MRLKTIYRLTLPSLAVLAVCNTALAVYVFIKTRSPLNYNIQVIEPPRIEFPTVTNELPQARSGLIPHRHSASVETLAVPSPRMPESWRMEYHYCVVGGKRVAVLNGVNVYEGDRHAYGVVRDIYPERIYFEGGNYIDNIDNRRTINASSTGIDTAP